MIMYFFMDSYINTVVPRKKMYSV